MDGGGGGVRKRLRLRKPIFPPKYAEHGCAQHAVITPANRRSGLGITVTRNAGQSNHADFSLCLL
jgi:hypothetical protein